MLYNTKGVRIAHSYRYLGRVTNNQAEYHSILLAINLARAHSYKTLLVHMDSKLVVSQVMGEWKVKEASLQALHRRVLDGVGHFSHFQARYIPRESNSEADLLANQAMDLSLQFLA